MRAQQAVSQSSALVVDDPLLSQLLLKRGIENRTEASLALADLLHYDQLHDCQRAAVRLAQAIHAQEAICIVGDYDADGATATALMLRALALFGAQKLLYLMPSRFKNGYGLSAELVDEAAAQGAQLLITVDNGIACVDAVRHAHKHSIDTIITDHHLPGDTLPDACAIVNPNQPACSFPSKALAGVGVAFYVMLALRAQLQQDARQRHEWHMSRLLDLVAIGTLADLVPLDKNNRILVQAGLERIRHQLASQGVVALLAVSNIAADMLTSSQVGFQLAPKINAAGRLADMALGVRCLTADNYQQAHQYATQLCALNNKRKALQQDILDEAIAQAERVKTNDKQGICLFDESWHEGLVGIIAGKLKDAYHEPAIVFALGEDGALKGSARSVRGLHIRDMLAVIDAHNPKLLLSFGGHAMAAGLRIAPSEFTVFQDVFFAAVTTHYAHAPSIEQAAVTDSEFPFAQCNYQYITQLIQSYPWGQSFPEPVFYNSLRVVHATVVGEKHIRFVMQCPATGLKTAAIYFFAPVALDDIVVDNMYHCVYSFLLSDFQGERSVQLRIQSLSEVTDESVMSPVSCHT